MQRTSLTRPWAVLAALSFALVWLPSALPAGEKPARRPNVLLIMADDLGYECLSANGSASYRTPNLDRLAREGARFTRCYTTPLCTPTRVQLMTGRYNFRNYDRFGTLPKGERTFAHMLKDAGYRTAVAGKWQLDEFNGQQPDEAGFEEWCLWNFRRSGHTALNDRYADANLLFRDPASGEDRFRRFEGEYGPDIAARYLSDFMERSVRAGKPFLAYYPMILTHSPFQPTPDSPEWAAGNRLQKRPRFFKDMVEYMDGLVGKLDRKLAELGVRENTLLIFTGDNGTHPTITSTMADGTTVVGGKGCLTEAGTRVPLVISWPGTVPARPASEELVDTTDILPTLAEATGAPVPRAAGDGILDGCSLLPAAKGRATIPREWILVDYRAGQRGPGKNDGRFVRDGRWKLYGFARDGAPLYNSGQLYDMERDPEEKTPVPPGDAEGDAARKRLQVVLDRMPS